MNNVSDILFSEWQEELKTLIAESSSLWLALIKTDGSLLFANPAMSVLLKDDPAKTILNPPLSELITSEHKTKVIYKGFLTVGDPNTINRSIKSTVYRKGDYLLIAGDLDASQLASINENMHLLNREISNLQRLLIRDKHKLEETLNKLNEVNTELTQANAAKDKFFSIIAHDLRSPFNSIVGFSSLLMEQIKENDYDGIEEYATFIFESSQLAMELLNNLLQWARSQTGKIEFKPQKIEIGAIISNVVNLLNAAAGQKSITISVNGAYPLNVFADSDMLKTVLRNLLSNAIKFTRHGGRITVSTKLEQHQLLVSVSDNGVGMSPETTAKLFLVEEHHSSPGTNNEAGTGLGLILCKEFITRHDGNIWVESAIDEGSIFHFSIPLREEEEEEEEEEYSILK